MSVAENITRIREGFGPSSAKLIAVTKNAQISQIEEAFSSGVTEFGESRVQDAFVKMNAVPAWLRNQSNWHFIGHLQTNKVKQVVGAFAIIHSVDSIKLAREISRVAEQKGIKQPILLQVKMTNDPNKSGFDPKELEYLFPQIAELTNIACHGLMTITPLQATSSQRKNCFLELRLLRDDLVRRYSVALPELSMGMSDDWQEALDCGSTMVRIGTAIFR